MRVRKGCARTKRRANLTAWVPDAGNQGYTIEASEETCHHKTAAYKTK